MAAATKSRKLTQDSKSTGEKGIFYGVPFCEVVWGWLRFGVGGGPARLSRSSRIQLGSICTDYACINVSKVMRKIDAFHYSHLNFSLTPPRALVSSDDESFFSQVSSVLFSSLLFLPYISLKSSRLHSQPDDVCSPACELLFTFAYFFLTPLYHHFPAGAILPPSSELLDGYILCMA